MQTTDERREDRDGAGQTEDVARYEQLRRLALDGDADGWRTGLAVLQHRGVVAWLHAWRTVTTTPHPPAPPRPAPPPGAGDRLVQTLASMALRAVSTGAAASG